MFTEVGLQWCGIDPQVPGSYPVTFSITQGSATTSVVRNVTILQPCGDEETRCSDQSCDLICESSEEGGKAPDEPPTLSLVLASGLEEVVEVK